jgi:hypothetical protein
MQRHLPLITPRIQFVPQLSASIPVITPRMDFTGAESKHRKRVTFASTTESSDSSSGASDTTDDDTDFEQQPPISKPSGEAGRPRSGGYNLEETLAWPKDQYEALVVRAPTTQCSALTHALAEKRPRSCFKVTRPEGKLQQATTAVDRRDL